MKNKLKKVKVENIEKMIEDNKFLKEIDFDKEEIFEIAKNNQSKKCECNNPLLNIEISLNRCERLGFFRN